MNRKDFITQAGVIGSSMLLAQASWAGGILTPGRQERIGIAVIGCGDRGKGLMHTLQTYLADKFEIRGYSDVLDFRLQEAKRYAQSSAKAAADYRSLLDDPSIAAVIIATPLHEHFRVAKDAWLAGKHVYLEKTMTYGLDEAFELVQLVNSRPGQTFQVGYQYRASPLYVRVKQLIESGAVGQVTQIDCRWDRNNNWRRPVPDPALERQINWRMYREYSGGLVAELLSHQMDFINWAFDTQPHQIAGFGGIDLYPDGRQTYDNVQLTLRYKDGMVGNFGTTLGNARDGYLFKIKGTKATISLLTNTGTFYPEAAFKEAAADQIVDGVTGATQIAANDEGGYAILPEPTRDGTIYALEEFHKCIRTGDTPSSNITTGAKGTICMALANESLYSSTIQTWEDSYSERIHARG